MSADKPESEVKVFICFISNLHRTMKSVLKGNLNIIICVPTFRSRSSVNVQQSIKIFHLHCR